MNTKRILFWSGFVVILALIVWGLIAAMNKPSSSGSQVGTPAPVSSSDHVLGSSNAPVTLIEYSDFQCPACEEYYPWVSRLLSESSSTVRFVYRHFPLDNLTPEGKVQHPNAVPAAMASEAAGLQGKFWEMSDLLFTKHADWTELSDPRPVFAGYGAQLGLNVPQFTADLSNSALKEKIYAQKREGEDIGISYTPSFFVNGKLISNPNSYDQFKAIVEQAAKGNTI